MTDRHHLKGLSLDTEFSSIDPREGHVNLVVQGSNVPCINRLLQLTPSASFPVASSSRCHSHFFKRGFFGEIGSAIGNTAGDIGDTTSDVGKNVTKTLIPVNINKDFEILNVNKSRPAEEGSGKPEFRADIKADTDTQARATVTLGVVVQGSIVPPKIEDFGVFAGMR